MNINEKHKKTDKQKKKNINELEKQNGMTHSFCLKITKNKTVYLKSA